MDNSTLAPEQGLTAYRQTQASVAMYIALVSWAMLFATVFLGYAVFRFSSTVWPPLGVERVDLLIPCLSTAVVLVSSCFYWLFEGKLRKDQRQSSLKYYVTALLFGGLFVVLQFTLWNSLKEQGLYASSGIFGSLIYSFTWLHTAHIAGGILALLYYLPHVRAVASNEEKVVKTLSLNNVGKFWHFLTIIWLFIFLFVFIL